MARSKAWTDEDREAALGWIARKAKTGAIFVGQDETADDMLPMLEGVTDLQAFSEAVQAALTTSAWKRLLGALRQRKHQADDEDQDQGPQQAEQQACRSCVQLQDEVDRLQRRETANVAWREAVMGAVQGNPQQLAAILRPMLAGTLQAFIEALQATDEVQVITPVIRDRAIIKMHQAGESKRGIARALGCSDGTVRNVIKRLQTEAA